jgi:hypothetical protein
VTRLSIALVLVAVLVLARHLHARWRQRLASDPRPLPRLPASLLAGAERTWVVFTTAYCAACGPVIERLREIEPDARVVTVDVGADRGLAEAFRIRTAPTVLLADADGEVRLRMVGAAAVDDYVRSPA